MSEFKTTKICTKILKEKVEKSGLSQAQARAYWMKKNLSPSMDFMCMTKAFFNIKYSGKNHMPVNPKDITYENERAKEIGNNFHNFIQKQFEEIGVLRLNETTLRDEEKKISARLDCVIEYNNELYLVELKSAKSYSMHIMDSDGAPDIEHQKQIQLYFHLLEINAEQPEIKAILKGRTITKGIILYESKNDHKIMEFMVNKNKDAIEELLRYSDVLWNYVNKDKEPKYKFEPDSPECMYKCSSVYYEKCHGKPKPDPKLEDNGTWGFANAKENAKDPKFI